MSARFLNGAVFSFIILAVTKINNIMASWGCLSPRIQLWSLSWSNHLVSGDLKITYSLIQWLNMLNNWVINPFCMYVSFSHPKFEGTILLLHSYIKMYSLWLVRCIKDLRCKA